MTTATIKITLFDNTEEFMDFDTHADMVEWVKECKTDRKSQGFVVKTIKRDEQSAAKISFQISQPICLGGQILATYEAN